MSPRSRGAAVYASRAHGPRRSTKASGARRAARVSMLGALMLGAASAWGGNLAMKAIELPPPQQAGAMSLEAALAARHSVRAFAARPLSLEQLGQLLWAAQGITHGAGQRTAPSAGALYPLEIYVVAGGVNGLEPGVYHYRPARHQLVPVAEGDRRARLAEAALGQDSVREAPAVLAFGAVAERTAAKYGQRAERYVDIEIGHAAENVALQATALGLGTVPVGAFDDARVTEAAAVGGGEEVRYLMPVGWPAGR